MIVRVALAVVICASLAVSLLWLQIVPIFESPDEAAHFDYAFALGTTKTLLRAGDGPVGDSEQIDAMMRKIDFGKLPFHPDARVQYDYGSKPFYDKLARIDARARPGFYGSPRRVRPILASIYPPGFYYLVGMTMHLAGFPRTGMVRAFFAARFTSIVLFAVGLLAWYGVMRNVGIRAVTALLLTALVGLSPLASFVSSYVQPDNLSFALTGLATLAALLVRRKNGSPRAVTLFALAIAALCLTKYQFALTVAVVTLPLVLPSLARGRFSGSSKALALLALGVFPALAVAISQWTMSSPQAQTYLQGSHSLTTPVHEAFGHGLRHGLAYLWSESLYAYDYLFAHGASFASFWGLFGWVDTPLSFGNYDLVVWSAIGYATAAAIVLCVVAAGRNALRLRRVALRRGYASAFRVAFSDPLINGYYLFALLMFALFVVSANGFGAQGRNWYPYQSAAFLVVTRYGPNAFPHGWARRAVSTIGTAALIGFVVVAGALSIVAVEDRYYSPHSTSVEITHLAMLPGPFQGNVDAVNVRRPDGTMTPLGHRTTLPKESSLEFVGWAYDAAVHRPLKSAYLTVDGHFAAFAGYGGARPDVANAFHEPALEFSGYETILPASELPPGDHVIRLDAIGANGDAIIDSVVLAHVRILR